MSTALAGAELRKLQEALDPTTPGPRLQALWDGLSRSYVPWGARDFEYTHDPIEQALAGNPNTPPQLLRDLGERYPIEVARNPALALHLLSEPSLLHGLPFTHLGELLRRADTPEPLVLSLLSHPTSAVAEGAALHRCVHGELRESLEDAVSRVQDGMSLLVTDALEELVRLELVPGAIRSRLREPRVERRRKAVGEDPAGSQAAASCEDPEEAVASLLCRPRLPRAELERLARDPIESVRERVARHAACPPELLLFLAGDVSRTVRRGVAESGRAPRGATERMIAPALSEAARTGVPICRWIALVHPRVPRTRLREAALSPYWTDRLAAALNPAPPRQAIAFLREDGNALVLAAARAKMGGQEVASQS